MSMHGKFCITVDDVTVARPKGESRNCGTGKGGFKPGNKCALGADGIPDAGALSHEDDLGGSTGASLMSDENGRKFVVKQGNSPGHITAETLADRLYEAMGAPVPAGKMSVGENGQPAKVAEYVEGKPLAHLPREEKAAAYEKLQEHFVADALLANWDVIGLAQDNIIVDKQGTPYRIDNGGSLKYRAQGASKDFGPEVGEIDTMRKSNQGRPIFGSLTDDEIAGQVAKIVARKDKILAAAASDPEIQDALLKRIDYLAKRFGQADEARASAVLERARLALRNCGTGKGGFQAGNNCAAGGDGDQAPQAVQTKASSYIKGSGSGKGFLEKVRLEIAQAIDELHTIPSGAPNVSLKKSAGETTVGAFSPAQNVIKVSANGEHPLMTVAHEFGHYLDWKVLGTGVSAATNGRGGADKGIKQFLSAVENSKAYKQIEAVRQLRVSEAPYGINEDVAKSLKGWSSRTSYGAYLMQPRELWARAYAQYVAQRSSGDAMKKELKTEIDSAIRPDHPSVSVPWTRQWEQDDFEPIAKAIDDILSARGMKK